MEREERLVIPSKVDKAANANVGPNVHCEGTLEEKQDESERGSALLLDLLTLKKPWFGST